MVYQFTVHGNLPKGSACPQHEMFTLYGKLLKGDKISSHDKQYIADHLWGTFGANSSTYRLGGFAAHFSEVLPRILVKQHGDWREYVAPNKSTLRNALYGHIDEMHYVGKIQAV